ncbi:MAG: tetratricopeptide repeat protein, partial [Cyclobacteriaceae bacterium]|nr:tetratricopeptide repeat protein [Cyclobacteriaceae bacterium]
MRIHHLIVLVAVIFPITPAFSYQDHSVIDSLKQLLQQENVSLSTYGVLAGKIYNYDTKASHYYASQMDSLAEVRKDTVNIIEAKNQLAEFFWRTGAYEEATHFALEALSIAEVWKKSPYKLARTHQTLGTIYLYLANSEKALENYNKALVIFTELNKPVDIAKVNNNSGVIYMDMKTEEGIAWGYDSAIARFKKVLDYQGLANNSTIINSMSNLIFLYKEMNMLESGMEILEKWDKFVAEEGPISSSSKA